MSDTFETAIWIGTARPRVLTLTIGDVDIVDGCLEDCDEQPDGSFAIRVSVTVRVPEPQIECRPPSGRTGVFHWLRCERTPAPAIAEWRNDVWYSPNEMGPISPREMARRGWRWAAEATPPGE